MKNQINLSFSEMQPVTLQGNKSLMSAELAHQKADKHLGYTLQRKLFAVCQAKGNKRQQLLWHMFIKNSKKRTFFFAG